MVAGADALDLQRRRRTVLTLSARHVSELVAELAPLVQGALVAEVVALPPRDLVLYFRADADAPIRRVHVAADGDAPRFYLQTARQQRPDAPLGPFFRRALAELTGARLRKLEQIARDRIVAFDFDLTPSGERRVLLAELIGRHANLVLLGPGERVLDVLVAPPANSKGTPRLVLGAPWQAPPGAARALDHGPSLAEELGLVADGAQARPDAHAPLSFLVQEQLGRAVAELALQRARRSVAERAERKLKRARSLEHGLLKRLEAASTADEVRLDGEALKASFHLLRRGLDELSVPDPYSDVGAERRIALDPRRSPQENVEQVFERYKKLLRARASVERELALNREKLAQYEALLAELATSAEPSALERDAVERGLLEPAQEGDERKRREVEPRKPYRVFCGVKGAEIRVGRSARDNDDLTLHHTRGNDVWLHTADAPGSHVVLRVEKQAEPDPEDVLDAAHLAVHFSPLRDALRADVHVARRKDVHKPRGAKPGLVTLSGGKVLAVRLQPERLRRLLDDSRG